MYANANRQSVLETEILGTLVCSSQVAAAPLLWRAGHLKATQVRGQKPAEQIHCSPVCSHHVQAGLDL